MREILGKRRRLLSQSGDAGPELIDSALTFAEDWQWPVLPGAAADQLPSVTEVAVTVALVAVMVTSAPGSGAPVESRTTPVS